MTISTTANRISYTGNGSTVDFSFPYPVLLTTDLVVIETIIATGVETVQVITTDYTIALVGGGATATVTAATAPASTVTWTIYRDPPVTQTTDFTDNDPLPAASLEDALDKNTQIDQRSRDIVVRTLRQPEGDTADIDYLPSKVDRAAKYLLFDSYGNPTVSTGTGSAASTTSSDLVSYSQGGTGHVTRTVEARLRDHVSVKDFGAVGDGVTDDTVALQAALDAAAGGVLFVPEGQYIVSETLYIPAGTALCGEGKYSLWTNDVQGTVFITTGAGNAQQWTDIDGSDPADDTPLFVAQGDGVYLDSVALLTGEGVQPEWSMGVLFPCVKQCGFSRLVARGFTDGCVYLDATWSDRNTTLINLHPEITPSTGMNEFKGSDYYLRAGGAAGFAVKIQGTTRFTESYGQAMAGAPPSSTWPWGWGGISDGYFSNGRLGADGANGGCLSVDVQLSVNDESRFGQGVHFTDTAMRLGNGRYQLKLDRVNRLIFYGIYAEKTGSGDSEIAITSRTQTGPNGIISYADRIGFDVLSIDGTPVSGSGMDLWAWSATRCFSRYRGDGRIFTPNLDLSTNNRVAKLTSFADYGEMRLTYDDGTTGTDFLRIQNDVIRPEVASSINVGTASFPFGQGAFDKIIMGGTGPRILFGAGSPEGAATAVVGSIYLRSDGGAGTSFYVKESGTGNTGWDAK